MNVLVIDREMFLAELVKLALEAEGHACFTATSVNEASEILRSLSIDFVALDLDATGGDPLGWLDDAMLEHPELYGHVSILTDRLLEGDDAVRALTCGAHVIQKPFTLQQVREAVSAMVPVGGKATESRARGPLMET